MSAFADILNLTATMDAIRNFGRKEIPIYYDPENVNEEFDGVCKELKLFGLKFRLYDALMGWWERKSDRDLIDFIDGSHSVRDAIELGVGTGYLLRLMARKYPHATIRGSDLSISMLRVTREKLIKHGYSPYEIEMVRDPFVPAETIEVERAEHIVLAHEDCRRINAPVESQDLITSSYLLDLLPPYQILEILSEICRLLRTGGKAYLMTLTSDVHGGRGIFGKFKELHFRMRNGFYAMYYHSKFLRKVSHTLFEGYYTHCRPICLSSYIRQCEGLVGTRTRQSYIRICGVPYLPVRIVEVTKL